MFMETVNIMRYLVFTNEDYTRNHLVERLLQVKKIYNRLNKYNISKILYSKQNMIQKY